MTTHADDQQEAPRPSRPRPHGGYMRPEAACCYLGIALGALALSLDSCACMVCWQVHDGGFGGGGVDGGGEGGVGLGGAIDIDVGALRRRLRCGGF